MTEEERLRAEGIALRARADKMTTAEESAAAKPLRAQAETLLLRAHELWKVRMAGIEAASAASISSQPAKATPAASSPPSPPKETTVTTPNPAEAIDRIAAGYAAAGIAIPSAMIARAKASGDSASFVVESSSFAAAARAERVRQEAEDALVSGIVSHVPGQRTAGGRSYSPGVPLTSLRSLAAEEPVRANPAADVDELVASIVAFIPRDRLANGAGLDVDDD